jgi:hypothetical protein
MVALGVVLAALAVLFFLTTLSLAATGRLRHAARVVLALTTLLVAGLAFLLD